MDRPPLPGAPNSGLAKMTTFVSPQLEPNGVGPAPTFTPPVADGALPRPVAAQLSSPRRGIHAGVAECKSTQGQDEGYRQQWSPRADISLGPFRTSGPGVLPSLRRYTHRLGGRPDQGERRVGHRQPSGPARPRVAGRQLLSILPESPRVEGEKPARRRRERGAPEERLP